MNVGELFVNLGIKGTDKAVSAAASVRSGLSEVASKGFAATAALAGLLYATERLMKPSTDYGMALSTTSTLLGVSTDTLQRYQQVARHAVGTNTGVAASFQHIQDAMTDIKIGKAPPEFMNYMESIIGKTPDFADMEMFSKAPELFVQRMQEYAQKEPDKALARRVIESLVGDESMTAAVMQNAFTPDALSHAAVYSGKDTKALKEGQQAISDLNNSIEMALGRFTAKHGKELIGEIKPVVDQIFKLAEAFDHLAEKSHLFDWIGKVFEGWTLIFTGLTKTIDELTHKDVPTAAGSAMSSKKGEEGGLFLALAGAAEALGFFEGAPQPTKIDKNHPPQHAENPLSSTLKDVAGVLRRFNAPTDPSLRLPGQSLVDAGTPRVPALPPGPSGPTSVTVQQTFQHPGDKPGQVRDAAKSGVKAAYDSLNKAGGH